jgi:hypothetical protein
MELNCVSLEEERKIPILQHAAHQQIPSIRSKETVSKSFVLRKT